MFKGMFGDCARRSAAGRCTKAGGGGACASVDWRQALAFAAGESSRVRSHGSNGAAPFPAFFGALAEALGRVDGPRRPVRRAADRRSFSRDVEAKLEPLLATGEIGMDRIARLLGCSRQTLYRRLREEGTTYEQLLDSLRRRLALRYIDREGLGVKQTAYRLGFSEPASFSRAFKRWTGRTPGRRS